MTIYESIGVLWVVLTCSFGTLVFFYFAVTGMRKFKEQRERGAIEENLDIRRQLEVRFLERIGKW
jgi:hypothetical protein